VVAWAALGGGGIGDASASPAELRGASIREADEVEVWLDVSAPVVPYARELAGTPGLEPTRLYFDLHETVLSAKAVREIEGKGAVRRVRLGQNDADTTRVVIELSSPRPFALEKRAQEVVIRFAPAPMAVASRAAPARLALARVMDAPERLAPPVEPTERTAEARRPRVQMPAHARSADGVAASPRVHAAAASSGAPAEPDADVVDAADLERRVARLHRRRDWPALLVLYAAEGSPVGEAAPAAVRAAVADALLAVGLPERADDVLGAPGPAEPSALRLARAEVALARGDERALRALLTSIDGEALRAPQARRLERLRIRAALAGGASLDAAAFEAGWTAELRRALARSTIETAEPAAAVGAFEQAAAAFARARDVSDAPALQAAAASGMLRAALELRDETRAADALQALADFEPEPMVQRVARSLATRSGLQLDEGKR